MQQGLSGQAASQHPALAHKLHVLFGGLGLGFRGLGSMDVHRCHTSYMAFVGFQMGSRVFKSSVSGVGHGFPARNTNRNNLVFGLGSDDPDQFNIPSLKKAV